jgi:PadR family transcriptional regulator, regulatory protein AphA
MKAKNSHRKKKTRYALLGILSQRECSGYEMRKYIENSIGFFWQESFGQIYPTLSELESESKIAPVTIKGRGTKPVPYRITATGRKELREWLSAETAPEVIRNELLLKVFFGKEAGAEILLAELQRHQRQGLELQKMFQQIQKQLSEVKNPSSHQPYTQLTLDYGRRAVKAEQEWLAEAISTLQKMN